MRSAPLPWQLERPLPKTAPCSSRFGFIGDVVARIANERDSPAVAHHRSTKVGAVYPAQRDDAPITVEGPGLAGDRLAADERLQVRRSIPPAIVGSAAVAGSLLAGLLGLWRVNAPQA